MPRTIQLLLFEVEQTSPTLHRLLKLARSLDLDLSQFVKGS
jgi:hypothetical protein